MKTRLFLLVITLLAAVSPKAGFYCIKCRPVVGVL